MNRLPAFQIEDLSVALGGHTILSGLHAEVAAGEFIGIFGPNGAGKTTLVRCLVGTLAPCGGVVKVLGRGPRQAARQIGYMPQGHPAQEASGLSARALATAAYQGERWGLPWSSRASRREVQRVLEVTGAAAYADRPLAVLSGGERQRVMLAQALLGDPEILILDEPLASLDPKNQALLIECVVAIKNLSRTTVLFVAHDLNPLLPVMDRVWYLAGGRGALGSVAEVVTSASLSQLYGFSIDVVRVGGRIFVVAAEGNVTEAAHHCG